MGEDEERVTRSTVRNRLDAAVGGLLINFAYSWIHTCV